jgi:hypothetical protein
VFGMPWQKIRCAVAGATPLKTSAGDTRNEFLTTSSTKSLKPGILCGRRRCYTRLDTMGPGGNL